MGIAKFLTGFEQAHIRSLPASQRLAVRKDKSTPMVAKFKNWLEQARAQVSAKSPTGEALKYIAKYWDGLILFLTDGRIEMDNNTVERTIRPIAIGRNYAHQVIMRSSLRAELQFLRLHWTRVASYRALF